MSEGVIEINDLRKSFSSDDVIKGISMHVPYRKIYGFLGANGAGKTTVFKLITGLLHKDSGSIHVAGLDIQENRDEILRKIGLSIEVPAFYEHLSAYDNLSVHLEYMGCDGDIKGVLEKVGLGGIDDRPVSKYSLGMRARLAIARAIVHEPELLILDEPINGLDPQGIKDMRKLFRYLCEKCGKTILISSHTLSEIEHIADIVGVIHNGILVAEDTMTDILELYPDGLEEYYFRMTGGVKDYAQAN